MANGEWRMANITSELTASLRALHKVMTSSCLPVLPATTPFGWMPGYGQACPKSDIAMAHGAWRMANGEWPMANGEWRMANCKRCRRHERDGWRRLRTIGARPLRINDLPVGICSALPQNMPPYDIQERAFEFACRIIDFGKPLFDGPIMLRELGRQLLKSGTSIGANLEEADDGERKATFGTKSG